MKGQSLSNSNKSTFVPIVSAFINIGCMIISLLFAKSLSPISVVASIIMPAVVLFSSEESRVWNLKNKFYFGITAISCFACFLVEAGSIITRNAERISHFEIRFKPELAFIGGITLDYGWFFGAAVMVVGFLSYKGIVVVGRETNMGNTVSEIPHSNLNEVQKNYSKAEQLPEEFKEPVAAVTKSDAKQV